MKNNLKIMAIILSFALVLFGGCSNSVSENNTNTNTANQMNLKINAGIVAPFTGDAASYGADITQGLEILKTDLAKENIELTSCIILVADHPSRICAFSGLA